MQGTSRGFKPKSKNKPFQGGGKIQGPGTGTSDDIQKDIPEGSYIMPADSTEAIGEGHLASMGKGIRANVSNGEYEMPPEQVHAVGAQVLDQMKGQTHTPTGKPPSSGPEIFFADGGLVDESRRLPAPQSTVRGLVPVAQPRADFYSNYRGDTARGFMPSSSRAVVPAGPVVSHEPGRALVPSGPLVEHPRPAGVDPVDMDKVRQRVKADTDDWKARAAGQDARAMGPHPEKPGLLSRAKGLVGRGFTPAVTAIGAYQEGKDVAAVAQDPNSSKWDVATQAAGGTSRTLGTLGGAAGGAKLGAAVGALGGPLAPVTVPAGALLGGIAGGWAGSEGVDKIIETGRRFLGADPRSPAEQINGESPSDLAGLAGAAGGAVTGGAGGLGVGRLVGRGADMLTSAATKGKYKGRGFETGLAGALGVTGAATGGIAGSTVADHMTRDPSQLPANKYAGGQMPQPSDGSGGDGQATQASRRGPLDNDITRVGNSFSGVNIRDGYTVNGERPESRGIRSPQNEAAVQALMARTPEFGQGAQARGFTPDAQAQRPQGPQVNVIRDTRSQDQLRQRAINAASTAHRGAQNGQLTAAQLNTLRSMTESDANNATQLTREEMNQQGQNQRSASRDQIDMRRLQGEETTRGFQNRSDARMESLYEKYAAASTPAERGAIAEQIALLNGARSNENLSNNFMKVKVPVFDERGNMIGEREQLVDLRQAGVGAQSAQPQAAPPANHIDALKKNPALAQQFDARYGQGAAAKFLEGN